MKQEEKPVIKTHRELITELLSRLHPESDLADEDTLFGIIYADYEAYAQLIESRESDIADAEVRGRNAQIEEILSDAPATDGIPALSGANTQCSPRHSSIFDVARG